jgi:hypothetical protein
MAKKKVKKKPVNNNLKKAVKKEVEKQVEKEVDEAEASVKRSVKRQVERAVEREVDEEVGPEVKKELTKALKKRFDLIDRFKSLEAHHKFVFAVLVGFGVISFWRGLWLFIDLAFFPDFPWFRALFATLLGLTILSATGALLRVMK